MFARPARSSMHFERRAPHTDDVIIDIFYCRHGYLHIFCVVLAVECPAE